MRARVMALTLATTMTLAGPSWAEPDESAIAAARELGREGVRLHAEGDYAAAIDRLSRAYAIVKVPAIAYSLGVSLEATGRLVEAAERYREAELMELPAVRPELQQQWQAKATERLAALGPRIPRVAVTVVGGGQDVAVTIDDHEVPTVMLGTPVPADPGEREVVAVRGEQRVAKRIVLREGETETVTLEMPPPNVPPPPSPPPPPVTQPAPAPPPTPPSEGAGWMTTAGWIGVGVGGAGLVVGVVAGSLLLSKDGDLDDRCNEDGACAPSASDDVDSFNTLRPVTTAGLVIGGIAGAVGVTLLILAPSDTTQAEVSAHPTGLRLRLSF